MLSEHLGTACFTLAVLHTFLVKWFQNLAVKFPSGSVAENLFHLLGEIEVVFGVWAGIYLLTLTALLGGNDSISYLESRNFTEPAFVFVIMVVCSTKPILLATEKLIDLVSNLLPFKKALSFYLTALIVGPLLGSFITEPAAMTVTALLLLNRLFNEDISEKLKYATIGLLFVNISIGGTLTPFAAPPVLMVASKWNWDLMFMLSNFGWKAAIAILISTSIIAFKFKKEFNSISLAKSSKDQSIPLWITLLHFLILGFVIVSAHHMAVFILIFLFFLGLVSVTKEYQDDLKIKEGLLVSFFLIGIVILGGPQGWWLEPIITKLNSLSLYLSAMGLTAITDNAALTYLGSQVAILSDNSKYALVAGSVVGGGLTVIANAPNPAGYGILNDSFGEEGISPVTLFISALVPTFISAICFWLL